MEITLTTFLIVCPLVFLAGLIDAIGGGGGLVSLPAYMLAGLPAHTAVATNKLSSACGTALATFRFIKNGLVNFKLAIPSVIAAICGSYIGAQLSMCINETILKNVLLVILPVIAFIVLNRKIFKDGGYIGAGLVMKNSSKIVKPTIIVVLILLLIKIIIEY